MGSKPLLNDILVFAAKTFEYIPFETKNLYHFTSNATSNFASNFVIRDYYLYFADQLTRALMAIDRSSKGYKVVMPTDIVAPPPPPTHPSTSGMKLPGFLVNAAHQAGMQQRTASFKELVEQRAAERGVAFIPQANKFREGKPVFWFGNISVYIDRNVVFALDLATNIWSPIGIDHLMAICE
jgi:tuftelin-interacting protein 11